MQSLLGPDKILGSSTRKVDASSFSKFMMGSGQNPLQNNSFNNIVNFNRTKIDPGVSSAPSLINSISNVVNNLKSENQNEIKNISQSVIQNVNKNIANIVNNLKSENQNEIKNVTKVVNNLKSENQNEIKNISQSVIQNVNKTIANIVNNLKSENQNDIKNVSNVISNLKSETQNEIKNISQSVIQNSKTINQNSFINLQDKIQNTLNSTIQNFTQDYQKKIQEAIDNKPSNILKNFLGLYKNVVDYITFFGDPKNNKRIETSFKSLRKIFNESFDTALVIRQAIVRIVRQLSNLPSASGNAPDLNLDVNVPGGKLKQSGASSIGKFARSPMGKALAIGGAVAGGVGLGVAGSSMIEDAKRRQEEKLRTNIQVKGRESGQTVPESLMDSLEKIIENFSDAIKRLVEASKKKSGVSMSSSTPSSPSAPPGPPGGDISPIDIGSFSEAEKSHMGRMIAAEVGTNASPQDAANVMNVMLNRYRLIKQGISSPKDWGIKGKTKDEVTLIDVLSVPKQWQPLTDGSFASKSKEEGLAALNKAASAGGNDPRKIYEAAKAAGMSEDAAMTMARSSAFYNPRTSSNKPFDSPSYRFPGGNPHEFMEAPGHKLKDTPSGFPTSKPLSINIQNQTGITTSRGGAQETSSITPNSQTTPSVAVVSAPPVPPVPSNITQSPSTSATRGSGSSSEIASLNNVIPITIPDTQQSPRANVVAEASGGTANSDIAFLEPFDFSQPNQCLALAYCNIVT